MTSVFGDCGGRVKDGVTSRRSHCKTLATQNLRERIRTSNTSGQPGRRRWLGLDPVNPSDRLGIRLNGANRLAIDIEDGEGETEVLRVEVEVAEKRIVPSAGRHCRIGPKGIEVGNVG